MKTMYDPDRENRNYWIGFLIVLFIAGAITVPSLNDAFRAINNITHPTSKDSKK
jgi:hypothetical protein